MSQFEPNSIELSPRQPLKLRREGSTSYYVLIRHDEAKFLGLDDKSYVKAQVVKITPSPEAENHNYKIEIETFRAELKALLDSYEDTTSIRKTVLAEKLEKIVGPIEG